MPDVNTIFAHPQPQARAKAHWGVGASSLALVIALAVPGAAHAAEVTPAAEQPAAPADTTASQAAPANSAATQPATQPASSTDQIGDITVTARRVTERLQDIPASVSAVTGEQAAGMRSLADVQSMVAGVTFQTIGPIPLVGIRGFGNRSQAGNPSQSAVGIYEDGVFVAPTLATIINRTDTDRVEIAKGPQSTLYGRSSFAGAFNIVGADPANHVAGYVDVGYGMSSTHGDDLWRIQGAISLPLSSTFGIRLYGLDEKRDGYIYDSVTGNHSGGYDRQIGRARILWQPSDAFTARLTGTILRDNMPLAFSLGGLVRSPLGQNVEFQDPASAAARTALHFGNTVWDASLLTPQVGKIRGEEATLDLRLRTPIGELASLSNYQHATLDNLFSIDQTRLNWANGRGTYYEKRYSQELRLSNTAGRLTYLFGAYFLDSRVAQGGGKVVDLNQPFATFSANSLQYDILHVDAVYQPTYTETKSYQVFGQLGYNLTDRLNLTVGLRYGRDELSGPAGVFLHNYLANILIPATPFTARSAAFNATTGSANLSYHIAPDVIAYASYARGNSPGGLNTGAASNRNFQPQNVDAFELGLRSRLLNRHLQLNLALFDNEYSDLQLAQNVIINGAITSIVSNAGKAHGRGFDIDAQAILSSNWRLGFQYTYVNSKITSYTLPAPPSPQVDLTGVPLVRSPRNTLNASITFNHDIGAGNFQFTAAESYSSSYTNDYQGVPAGTAYPGIPGVLPAGVTTTQVLGLYRERGYALTNLTASYTLHGWQLSASVRNLFNKQYDATLVAFDVFTVPLEVPGAPRTAEVSLRYSF